MARVYVFPRSKNSASLSKDCKNKGTVKMNELEILKQIPVQSGHQLTIKNSYGSLLVLASFNTLRADHASLEWLTETQFPVETISFHPLLD